MEPVFPSPYPRATPPTWAMAVVAAALMVTLLWCMGLIALLVCRALKGTSAAYDVNSNSQHTPQSHIAHRRRHMTKPLTSPTHSLGTPPPPVHPPTSKLIKPDWSQVEVNPGYQDSADSADEDPLVRCDSVGSIVKKKPVEPAKPSPHSPLAGMVLSRPITVRQLGATLREPGYIDSEFKKLPVPSVSPQDCPPGAERKNRYSNVLPTPRTRVPLGNGYQYINANYLRGYKGIPHTYIATQAPLSNTVADFWSMVWDNRSEVIVMATDFQERDVDKCCRYWPATGSQLYGSVQVTVLAYDEVSSGNYSRTTLQINVGDECRTLEHYKLTWPDMGIPPTTKLLTDFLREAKLCTGAGPAVIHCSAGIGRTGVIAAVDIGLASLSAGEGKLDILRIVSTMRQDRAGCVQTKDQYRYIHQCLYDASRKELTTASH